MCARLDPLENGREAQIREIGFISDSWGDGGGHGNRSSDMAVDLMCNIFELRNGSSEQLLTRDCAESVLATKCVYEYANGLVFGINLLEETFLKGFMPVQDTAVCCKWCATRN